MCFKCIILGIHIINSYIITSNFFREIYGKIYGTYKWEFTPHYLETNLWRKFFGVLYRRILRVYTYSLVARVGIAAT